MKISMGCDHGGYDLKEHLKQYLTEKGHEVIDVGIESKTRCNYPVFGAAAARLVASGECQRGIVICTTGIGISICANKIHGIRCALCGDSLSAELCRRHNDANMLALGAGIVGPMLAERITDIFMETPFDGGRHTERVALMMGLEEK